MMNHDLYFVRERRTAPRDSYPGYQCQIPTTFIVSVERQNYKQSPYLTKARNEPGREVKDTGVMVPEAHAPSYLW